MPEPTPGDDRGGATPLTPAYRILRRLAPPESPFDAVLARTHADAAVVLVDAGALAGWRGWTSSDPHVLGLLDVAMTERGTAAVLPWCTEPVDRLLARRRMAGSPLSGGEAVTLAVSLVRGVAALAFDSRETESLSVGSWWLTDDACPVFVHGVAGSGEPAEGSAGVLLAEAAELCADGAVARMLAVVSGALDDPRSLVRDVERLEAQLFATAAAEPIETAVLAPARARDVAVTLGGAGAFAAPAPDDPIRRGALAPLLDAGLVDLVSGAVATVARRLRGRRRIAAWSVAAAVGATVLTVGLLWPEPAGSPAAAQDDTRADARPESIATPTTAGDPTLPGVAGESDEPATSAAEAIEAEVGRLLGERSACGEDAGCLAAVVEDPARKFPAGIVDASEAEREVTLLDEFGGAAVLRVQSTSGVGDAQLVVVVRGDEGWLLRDVHDVAEQSGSG